MPGAGGGTAAACEVDCIKDLFQKQFVCKVCHSKGAAQTTGGGLDLESDGFTSRLKDKSAKHEGMGVDKANCPVGDKLIDSASPAESWLLKKINNAQGMCGKVMPPSGSLMPAQKSCIETYITCAAGGT